MRSVPYEYNVSLASPRKRCVSKVLSNIDAFDESPTSAVINEAKGVENSEKIKALSNEFGDTKITKVTQQYPFV
jgi:hypothetical protein